MAFLATMFASAAAHAQSTARVGHYERPLQFDFSAGTSLEADNPRDYCCGSGPSRFASAGLRWRAGGDAGVRVGVTGLDRRTDRTYPAFNSGTQQDIFVRKHERIVAVTLSADATMRLIADLRAGISVGGGVVPYARGEQTSSAPSQGYPQTYDTKESGLVGMGSVSLRYRWLFVEQHLLLLSGANNAILENREFFPVAVGLRF